MSMEEATKIHQGSDGENSPREGLNIFNNELINPSDTHISDQNEMMPQQMPQQMQ